MGVDNWDPEVEQAFVLALAPLMKEMADYIKARLPATTDFALLIGVPSPETGAMGRVLAISTDRQRMALLAAQWSLTIHETRAADVERTPAPGPVNPPCSCSGAMGDDPDCLRHGGGQR
jgi:hypothetical protein